MTTFYRFSTELHEPLYKALMQEAEVKHETLSATARRVMADGLRAQGHAEIPPWEMATDLEYVRPAWRAALAIFAVPSANSGWRE